MYKRNLTFGWLLPTADDDVVGIVKVDVTVVVFVVIFVVDVVDVDPPISRRTEHTVVVTDAIDVAHVDVEDCVGDDELNLCIDVVGDGVAGVSTFVVSFVGVSDIDVGKGKEGSETGGID